MHYIGSNNVTLMSRPSSLRQNDKWLTTLCQSWVICGSQCLCKSRLTGCVSL